MEFDRGDTVSAAPNSDQTPAGHTLLGAPTGQPAPGGVEALAVALFRGQYIDTEVAAAAAAITWRQLLDDDRAEWLHLAATALTFLENAGRLLPEDGETRQEWAAVARDFRDIARQVQDAIHCAQLTPALVRAEATYRRLAEQAAADTEGEQG